MNLIPFEEPFGFSNGFFPDAPDFGDIIPRSVKDGSNAWFHDGQWYSDQETGVGSASGGVSDLQIIEDQLAGCSGIGNLWSAFSTVFFTGAAFRAGAAIGSVGTTLSLLVGGSPVAAGLATPAAPTFVASATSGRLSGAYSVVVQAFRQTTGALSSRSAPSATISPVNKKGTVTFPAAPSGTTHWVISGSFRGVPQGPWFRLSNVAIVPVATPSIEIDWVNGELSDEAEINFDPPPACTHVAALGACVMALGTGTGGYGVRPSIIAKPEAFPPEFAFDLPVRAPITGVQPGIDGVVMVSTRNGLMALLLSGSSITPVLPRVVFGNIGFARSNSWCAVYDQIYGLSNQAGAVRTQGSENPDSSFARPVQRYLMNNGFTSANSVVVYDQAHDAVIFASGTKALPYMRASGVWSAPITLPGTVTAGVSFNGLAHLQIGTSTVTLDQGAAGGSWFLRSPYVGVAGGHALNVKRLREWYATAGSGVTIDLLKDRSGSTIGGLFPYTISAPHGALGARVKKSSRYFRSLALKVSGSTGNQTFEQGIAKGYAYPIAA